MPEAFMHYHMGCLVLDQLSFPIDRNVFFVGVHGPDPFMFYPFPPNRKSRVMHNEKTGEFLMGLADKSVEEPGVFSFLAGFLCHYALDSSAHPMINTLSRKHGMHMAIEHRLDLQELRRQGFSLSDRPISGVFPPFPELPIDDVFQKIYGWQNSTALMKKSYQYMQMYFRCVETDAVNRIFRHIPGRFNAISYRSTMCSGVDLSWMPSILSKSVTDAVAYIRGAQAYCMGETDRQTLADLIGDRKYSGTS